jgi:chromosome segregation ATPase
MIRQLWSHAPVHLKAPLRNCSIIVSARRTKRGPLFPTAANGLEQYSRIPPVTPPDRFATEIDNWLSFRMNNHPDEWGRLEACQEAFSRLLPKLGRNGRPLKAVKIGYDRLIRELDESTSRYQKRSAELHSSAVTVLDQIDEQKDKASSKIRKLQTHLELVRSLTGDISLENESLTVEIRQVREETASEEFRVGRKRIAMEDLQEEFATAELQRSDAIEKFKASSERTELLKGMIDDELAKISEVLERCYALSTQIGILNEKLVGVKAERTAVHKKHAAVSSTEQSLRKVISLRVTEMENLKSEIARIESENRAMEAAKTALQK